LFSQACASPCGLRFGLGFHIPALQAGQNQSLISANKPDETGRPCLPIKQAQGIHWHCQADDSNV